MTIQPLLGALAFLPLALTTDFQPAPAKAAPALAPQVLVDLEAPNTLPLQGPVARHRTIAVRTELLADAAAAGGTLTLEPFPGERYELRDLRVEPAWGGGVVYWASMVAPGGKVAGTAAVSVFEDAVSASLRLDHALLRIEPAGDGAHRVVEIDESRMPGCGTSGEVHSIPPTAPALGQGGQGSAKAAKANAAPTIDIIAAYTPAAKNGQGGTNAMNALINLAVSESNTGYANSDVLQRYRLVNAPEMVGYTEVADFVTNLNRFQSPSDGFMDEVHTLRNQYGADACCLILNGSQYCGVAYGIMGAPSNGFAPLAFQVTARSCATGYYSFSHEFGHLFGCHHDKANGGVAYYPYAYGWRTTSGAWRTVMAYAPGTRVNYFSNPNKTYGGEALGVVNQAENYRALNNNAPASSQWRCAIPQNYCVGKFTSTLKYPVMGFLGKPIASGAGNFYATIKDAEPNKFAIVFYGTQPNNTPMLGGTLCVAPPLTRLNAVLTDGNGNAAFPFPITQFVAGDVVYAQGWFRDPSQPDGTGSGLTDGLRIDVCLYNN